MNHDACHCYDYKKGVCPKKCYRAKLTEELKRIVYLADALIARYDEEHKGTPGRARELITEAPTIDAEPVKHGAWVLKERAHYFKCSLCKEPIPYKFGYTNSRRYYNYCPNCGAKMNGKRRPKDD
jgi:hypothetical protein